MIRRVLVFFGVIVLCFGMMWWKMQLDDKADQWRTDWVAGDYVLRLEEGDLDLFAEGVLHVTLKVEEGRVQQEKGDGKKLEVAVFLKALAETMRAADVHAQWTLGYGDGGGKALAAKRGAWLQRMGLLYGVPEQQQELVLEELREGDGGEVVLHLYRPSAVGG